MHAFKAIAALAFAVPVLTNPLLRRQCAETCGSTCYSQDDINAAVQQGYGYYAQGTTVGSDEYPHQYEDYEGFTFPDAGPYYEFPILSDEEVYTGGSPGPDRVIFTGDANFDMVMTGQYNVVNCGGSTSLVVNLLSRLYSSLLPVIQDANSDNPSPAYKAFFKDPSYAPFISALFTNVTTGVPLTPPAPYSFNGGATFICVTAPEQFTYDHGGRTDAYTECLANPIVTSNYVGFDPPKQYIILCPSFFTSNIVTVPPPNTCLTVSTYLNRFRGSGQDFWGYKMWILLVMITHYYLYTSKRILTITDLNDANKCFRLPAEQSILNANNYVYYAASIHGHCTDFPTSINDSREILEIDIGDPSDEGPDDASPAVVTYIATDLELGVEDTTRTP